MSCGPLHAARLLLGALGIAGAAIGAAQAPDAETLTRASALLAQCAQVEFEDLALLSERSRNMLEDLAFAGRHGQALTEHHHLDVHSWLRHMRAGSIDIDALAAFRALCADGQFAAMATALASLHVGEAAGDGQLAWVPLLAPGDAGYTTLGLAFSRTDEGPWRLELRPSLVQEWVLETPALTALRVRMEQAGPGLDNASMEPPAACRASAPPQPLDGREPQAAIARFEQAWHALEDPLPGPVNAISTLQRQALRRYAEGVEVPADALAQALNAEALYRSAFFRRGPRHDSPDWWRQLARAVMMARNAAAAGAPIQRMAELVGHYARIVEHGTPAHPADFAEAAGLYAWAAGQGDIGSTYRWAQYQWEGIGPVAPNCGAADRTLQSLRPPDGLLERAQLAIDCPEAALRNPAAAGSLLVQVRAWQEAESIWEDAQVEALELAVRCSLVDPAGPGCVGRQPQMFSGQLQAQLREQDSAEAEAADSDAAEPRDSSEPDDIADAHSPLPYSLRYLPHPWPPGWPAPAEQPRLRQAGC